MLVTLVVMLHVKYIPAVISIADNRDNTTVLPKKNETRLKPSVRIERLGKVKLKPGINSITASKMLRSINTINSNII
jgi:hypothetical protein